MRARCDEKNARSILGAPGPSAAGDILIERYIMISFIVSFIIIITIVIIIIVIVTIIIVIIIIIFE